MSSRIIPPTNLTDFCPGKIKQLFSYLQDVVRRRDTKKTGISKQVNMHSLRHSYATHLLEDGINIVIIKQLLGHVQISTTMIYLHVAQIPYKPPHSPLDKLYANQR